MLKLSMNYHILKFFTPWCYKYPLLHRNSCNRDRLTHTHSGPHFWVLWVPYGSNPKFDSPLTTAYIWCNSCPNFIILALLA